MNIPLLDLTREWASIRQEVTDKWTDVLTSMRLLNGQYLAEFEKQMAAYLDVKHVIGVASGTDALTLGLIAAGVGPGNNVVVAANTFAAAIEAIRIVGAEPRIADTQQADYSMDMGSLHSRIDKNTAAVIITHMYGMPADMNEVIEFLYDKKIALIEDASHAHGATYAGKKVGTFGKVGCFSCGPVKNLGCYGDGGFVSTDDDDVAKQVRLLQVHGQSPKNNHKVYGFNSRLDELQAVILLTKLKYLDDRNARRRDIARKYDDVFAKFGFLPIPGYYKNRVCVYHQYVIRTEQRVALEKHLKEAGIGTGIHYPVPLHMQTSWISTYHNCACINAELISARILSIPVWPDMTDEEVNYVIETINSFTG